MPHYNEYRCSVCKQLTDRLLLHIKRAVFYRMTAPSKVTRSRTVSWLCGPCLKEDPDYIRESFAGPGHTSPSLERARADVAARVADSAEKR